MGYKTANLSELQEMLSVTDKMIEEATQAIRSNSARNFESDSDIQSGKISRAEWHAFSVAQVAKMKHLRNYRGELEDYRQKIQNEIDRLSK